MIACPTTCSQGVEYCYVLALLVSSTCFTIHRVNTRTTISVDRFAYTANRLLRGHFCSQEQLCTKNLTAIENVIMDDFCISRKTNFTRIFEEQYEELGIS